MTFRRAVDLVQYLALALTVVFVIALFTNDASVPAPAGDPAAAAGADVYADNCAGCHGASGDGGVGPALGGGAVVAALPDPADQVAVITDGRGSMPAFGGRLSAEEIQAVTDYTRDGL